MSILGVSKQLRAETFEVMKHHKLPGPRDYRLDVMLINGEDLWPTWLYVPCLTTRVESLVATLRDVGPTGGRYGRGFRGGDGGPPWIVWGFHNLLIRFLETGPMGPQGKSIDRGVSVQTVVLDIMTPDVRPDMIASVRNSTAGKLRKLSREMGHEMLMSPLYILAFMRRWLSFMSGTRSYGGDLILMRVGMLRLMLDGALIEEYDFAEQYVKYLLAFLYYEARKTWT